MARVRRAAIPLYGCEKTCWSGHVHRSLSDRYLETEDALVGWKGVGDEVSPGWRFRMLRDGDLRKLLTDGRRSTRPEE